MNENGIRILLGLFKLLFIF